MHSTPASNLNLHNPRTLSADGLRAELVLVATQTQTTTSMLKTGPPPASGGDAGGTFRPRALRLMLMARAGPWGPGSGWSKAPRVRCRRASGRGELGPAPRAAAGVQIGT